MKAPQQTETLPATPEQLLQLLDLQLARERSKRGQGGRKRAMILVFGILGIAIAAGIALFVAQQMVIDLQDRGAGHLPPSAADVAGGKL